MREKMREYLLAHERVGMIDEFEYGGAARELVFLSVRRVAEFQHVPGSPQFIAFGQPPDLFLARLDCQQRLVPGAQFGEVACFALVLILLQVPLQLLPRGRRLSTVGQLIKVEDDVANALVVRLRKLLFFDQLAALDGELERVPIGM